MRRYEVRRALVAPAVALAVVTGAAGCSGAGQVGADGGSTSNQQHSSDDGEAHASRVKFYGSLKAITKDSAVVVVGTAGPQTVADDLNTGLDFTLTSFTVDTVLKHKDVPPKGSSVIVRQDGSGSVPPSAKLLETGKEYLLFLTASGLPGDLASQYYVTGANAGLYVDAADAPPPVASTQADGAASSKTPLPKALPGTFVPTDPSSEDSLPASVVPADVEAVDVSVAG